MNRLKLYTVLSLITVMMLSFYSCKKYEEGPGLSFRSKTNRMANTWKMDYAYDINNALIITADFEGDTWELTKEGVITKKENGVLASSGTWEFLNNKEVLQINIDGTGSSTETYQILKLKEKEMWIKDKDQEYHFVPAS